MHRQNIFDLLSRYRPEDEEDKLTLSRLQTFVTQNPRCFERSLSSGHLTGSAWIMNPDRDRVLLTHHRKLNRWLQPGGHADGNPDILAVASREAREETGLTSLRLLSPHIFDLDIHLIPATPTVPAHYHYDIRFIFEADPAEPLTVSQESKELGWIALHELSKFNPDSSMLRMVRKTKTFSD
jgi:8-oxo-dGTP pyrophosphatase MutT (NUDIX family)